MTLWTIQPLEIWNITQETGVYRCDPAKSSMPEFEESYQWMICQMEQRIGPRPAGVQYPVWAWYMKNCKRKRPDLRSERWGNGPENKDRVCIELEIPDDQVLLSDFDEWIIVLNDGLISDTEEEYRQLKAYYDKLSPEDQKTFKHRNWERVLNTTPLKSHWTTRGEWIQATFWELRKEMIQDARFFRTTKRKEDY